jgi:hypothetical protein
MPVGLFRNLDDVQCYLYMTMDRLKESWSIPDSVVPTQTRQVRKKTNLKRKRSSIKAIVARKRHDVQLVAEVTLTSTNNNHKEYSLLQGNIDRWRLKPQFRVTVSGETVSMSTHLDPTTSYTKEGFERDMNILRYQVFQPLGIKLQGVIHVYWMYGTRKEDYTY